MIPQRHRGVKISIRMHSLVLNNIVSLQNLIQIVMYSVCSELTVLNCGVREDSLESLGTARRSNKSVLKEISPEYSLEGPMLKLKLQYFGHFMQRTDLLEKTLTLGKTEGQEEKGTTEDEMVGWHHRLNGHVFESTLGAGDTQGSLSCCSP